MKVAERTKEKTIEICPSCGSKMEKRYVASKIISRSNKKSAIGHPRGFSAGKQ